MSKRKLFAPLECSICTEEYGFQCRLPLVGKCGHTICSLCCMQIGKVCPVCQMATAFTTKTKNYQLLEIINEAGRPKKKREPKDPHDCNKCGMKIEEDKAYICISCTRRKDQRMKSSEFLEKAGENRFCESCLPTEDEGHDHMQKEINTKASVASIDVKNYVKYGYMKDEMDKAIECITSSSARLQELFPIGRKYSAECSKEEIEKLTSKAKECHLAVAVQFGGAMAEMYRHAFEMEKACKALKELDHIATVEYGAVDREIMESLKEPEDNQPGRPVIPRSAVQYYLEEQHDIPLAESRSISEQSWAKNKFDAVQNKSHYISREIEDHERYVKEMAEYFC